MELRPPAWGEYITGAVNSQKLIAGVITDCRGDGCFDKKEMQLNCFINVYAYAHKLVLLSLGQTTFTQRATVNAEIHN